MPLNLCSTPKISVTIGLTFIYLWLMNLATQNMAVRMPKFYKLGKTWIYIFSAHLLDLNKLYHTTHSGTLYRLYNCSGIIFNMDDSSYSTSEDLCLSSLRTTDHLAENRHRIKVFRSVVEDV